MLIGTNFDFDQNQLLRPVLHNLTSDPGSGVEGQLYVNTASHLIRAYLNGAWTTLSTAGGTLTGSATAGQIAVWSGTNSVGGITAVNSAVLVTNGSGVASLSTDLPTAETIGGAYIYRAGGTDIPVSDGGTGQTAFTQYALIYAPTTGSLGNIVDVSATGKALVSTSAGAPVFGKVTLTQPASQATLTLASGTTLQTANNVTFGGSYAITINSAGSSTNVTLPASGTLVGSADSGTVTNAMLANTTIKIGSSTYTLGAAFVTTLGGMSNIGIIAGTTTVAPFNFSTSGSVLLTTAVIGALEWDQTSLYITNAGPTRRTLLYADFSNIGSSILSGTNGGTGVNNGSKTITLGGNLTTTGAYNTSFTQQGSFTFILPPQAGTLISTGDTGTVTNTMLAGSIANNKLANSTILLGGQTLTLGAAATTALTGMTNITFAAGTATVAPINLTSGVVLTTPVVGAFEFVTDTLSFTITTGATRKTIAFTDSAMTNLVGAAWATPYQTGLNTTGMLANPAAANRVMLSGNSAAPSWSGGTLTIAASGSLAIPAFAVSFANAFSTLGAYSIALTATNVTAITLPTTGTLATLAGVEALSSKTITGSTYNGLSLTANSTGFSIAGGTTSKTLQVNNTLTLAGIDSSVITFNGTFTTSAAFSTTGTGTLILANGSTNSTLTLPGVSTANLVYNTTNPAANNQVAYGATSGSAALSYVTAPASLSVLTQSSAAAAPAWTTATGTGSPVFGTDPTMTFTTQGHLQVSYVPASANDVINKGYVDALFQGLGIKGSAKIAVAYASLPANSYANGPGTITGTANGPLPVINGYTPVLNDLILVTSAAGSVSDGLYKLTQLGVGGSTPFILTRDVSMDATTEFSGALIAVETTDTTFPGSLWLCTNVSAITLGTTPITFTQINKATDWTIGNGIFLTTGVSQTLSINLNGSNGAFAQYGIFYAGTTTQFSQVSAPGTNNLALVGQTAGAPSWSTLVITPTGGSNATITLAAGSTLTTTGAYNTTFAAGASITLTLPTVTSSLAYGVGTAQYQVAYFNGANASLAPVALNATANNMYLKQVSSGAPAFASLVSSDVTGALGYTPCKKFVQTFTGAGPSFGPYTHGLGSANITWAIYDQSGNAMIADVLVTATQVTVTWGYGVPAGNTYTLVCTG